MVSPVFGPPRNDDRHLRDGLASVRADVYPGLYGHFYEDVLKPHRADTFKKIMHNIAGHAPDVVASPGVVPDLTP